VIELVARSIIPAACSILPPTMDTPEARAMLIAIGLQESLFQHRRQTNFGPARGFWQFEKGGVRGVVKHAHTRGPLIDALRALCYPELVEQKANQTAGLHYAIEDNDVLACVFARLLLWTVPADLPERDDDVAGWEQYIEAWRPGKPNPQMWKKFFRHGWQFVDQQEDTQ
jgi:hypothetical protein